MLEWLQEGFALVCGQNPAHTWAPGEVLLPFCQRCTGLYAGAVLAALLHLWLRPRLTGRFLAIHGAFLLFMAPFGFHWVEHGPGLRTITGTLFGFGVVTFLWLPVKAWWADREPELAGVSQKAPPPATGFSERRAAWRYGAGVVLAVAVLPVLSARGGPWAAGLLYLSGLAGALVFVALVLANVGLVIRFGRRVLFGKPRPLAS